MVALESLYCGSQFSIEDAQTEAEEKSNLTADRVEIDLCKSFFGVNGTMGVLNFDAVNYADSGVIE